MASRMPIDGPDFICIGMPKAGTGWLYDQLQHHPDFWMPPIKEIHYLDHENPRMRSAQRHLERQEARGDDGDRKEKKRKRKDRDDGVQRRRVGDERDLGFLRAAVDMSGEARDVERYCSLFRFKGDLLTGDITPGYVQLEADLIGQLAARLPDTKVMLLVRDPVAREWSHLCMLNRSEAKGGFDPALMDDPDAFRDYLHGSILHGKLLSTKIYETWKSAAPHMDIRFFLFDDIVRQPEETRSTILTYLGADPAKESAVPANYNPKAGQSKIELSDTAKAVLVDYLKDEIKACATTFGGHARGWAAQYGL